MFSFHHSKFGDNRIYCLVDDLFDITLLRTKDGLLINVYDNQETNLLGTLSIGEHALAPDREDCS